jgi:hypothetical protein
MQQNRTIIIVIVVLVVIFIVGVVRGPTQGGNNTVNIGDIKNGILGTLHDLLVNPHPLTVQDVQGSCFSGDNLKLLVTQGTTCTYTIVEHRGIPDRNVKLTLISGSHATLTLVPQGGITGTLGIANSTSTSNLNVFQGGGRLMVACDGIGNCELTFP